MPVSLVTVIIRPFPSVTVIFWVNKFVGEMTGFTHKGSGVAGIGHAVVARVTAGAAVKAQRWQWALPMGELSSVWAAEA